MAFAWLGKKARAEDDEDEVGRSDDGNAGGGDDRGAPRRAGGRKGDGAGHHHGDGGSSDAGGSSEGVQNTTNKFSVHVTHVPFSATQHDLDAFFRGHHCAVDDIRMVRKLNHHQDGGERVFTGVAFVDLSDAESHAKALGLHQSKLWPGSLKINIRPTLDKTKLATVAAGRTNQVQAKKDAQVDRKVQKLSALGIDAADIVPPVADNGPAKRKQPHHRGGGAMKKKQNPAKKKKQGRKERMRLREQKQQQQQQPPPPP